MLTIEQMHDVKAKVFKEIELRTQKVDASKNHICICGVSGCASSGSLKIEERFKEEVAKHSLEGIEIITTGCMGLCKAGPIVIIYPEGTFYSGIKPEDAPRIVKEHLVEKQPVEDLIYEGSKQEGKLLPIGEVDFYKDQLRIALKNLGVIDPNSLEEYLAFDGYQALAKALTAMTREEVIQTIKDSGLRGRGGGGFSSGTKWEFTYKAAGDQKYVICNADEGDPGAFMDRSVLEGDPHAIIEAMAIAGYAVGANQGYVYIRAEYPGAVAQLGKAIDQAKEAGFLGTNIFGTDFAFDLEIRLGAGAFVCGEETALIASIEGYRGMPRPRPPFPAVKGLWGKPTLINNVETYANVPQIILNGADWFSAIGTEKSKGTKVFALGGKIKNTGLLEVPMGTTLRDVIYNVGGGIPNGKKFKAVQTGGPSGGCIPEEHLDTEIDYDNLIKLGSMMGSGGMIVMDEDNCMVDIAKFFLEFTVEESCGKCAPCREGTRQMLKILEKITDGTGTLEDIDRLEMLAKTTQVGSLCGLGQSAANPVVSTLRYFRDEYIAHVTEKRCPAKACQGLSKYKITDKCIGCTLCSRKCPVHAISGERKTVHAINAEACIKCGVCIENCKFGAIVVE